MSCSKVSLKSMKSEMLEISVKDTGSGISIADQQRLFKLFGSVRWADMTGSNTSGIGLGLFMSRKLVEQFGGEIGFDSEPGKGSDFYFTFALKEEDPTVLSKKYKMHNQVNSIFKSPPLRQKQVALSWKSIDMNLFSDMHSEDRLQESTNFPQILIVDDQVFNIEALKIILKLSNINLSSQVEKALNGQQAVDKVKGRSLHNMYDIIFMDCNMPNKDGPTATQEIRDYINGLNSENDG